jgi:CelD/BcsL family acetyltransferase involved in cellulose biosynthesis
MIRSLDLKTASGALPGAARPARLLASGDFRDFSGLWPRSCDRSEARFYAFQCAELIELRLQTAIAARGGEPRFVAVLGEDDAPLALMAFSIERERYSRFAPDAATLRFLDGGLADYNAPVLYPAAAHWDAPTRRRVWRAALRILPPVDFAVLEKMPERVVDLPNPLHALSQYRFGVSGHGAKLPENWAEFSARLPHRKNWKSGRFRALGPVTLEIATTPERYGEIVEVLIAQKRRRYLQTWGSDGLARPGYLDYLRGAARLAYPNGPACLFALKAGEAVIAANLGLKTGERFSGQFTTYDDGAWAEFSPGALLMNKVVEWCHAAGVRILDFGIGDDRYKASYCDIDIPLYQAEIAVSRRARFAVQARRVALWARDLRRRTSGSERRTASAPLESPGDKAARK